MDRKKFYFRKFRGKTFVIKLGGQIIASTAILESILTDIVDLMSHGIRVVLVHGGGPQADTLTKRLGHVPTKIGGRRVTEAKDLEVVKMLYGGTLNLEILRLLKKLGAKGMRVSGLDGNLLNVELRCKKQFDYGFVGDIKSVNGQVLKDLLKLGYLPVVSPLGVTEDGTIVNINADTIATEIAKTLKSEKLIFLTASDGLLNGQELISTVTTSQIRQMVKDGTITDGMVVKMENCINAIESGVKRVHIINGLHQHSLVAEVVTKSGVGTMVISPKEEANYFNE